MKFFVCALVLILAVYCAEAGISGTGKTTRYWDCCKPSCAWKENCNKSSKKYPIKSCSKDGKTNVDASVQSACNGGTSYMCNDQQPWAVNNSLAYGFVAGSFTGGVDTNKCCVCLELKFTDQLVGKTMIVQVTNTGSDLSANHFDIAMPGSGVGIFTTGCSSQWGCPSTGWGQQYGGVSSASECSQLPSQLQPGCNFRFNWFKNANNPGVTFTQVKCPTAIVAKSGCDN